MILTSTRTLEMVWGGDCHTTSLRCRKGLDTESLEEKKLRDMIDKLDDVVIVLKCGKEEKIIPATTKSCVCLPYMDKGYTIYTQKKLKSR